MSYPLHEAQKVPRVGTRFRETKGNIAAIDFGTTFCSLAYITQHNSKRKLLKADYTRTRVPTAILLKLKGPKPIAPPNPGDPSPAYEVKEIGYRAQDRYARMDPAEQQEYLYFARMKMMLQHDKKVERNMALEAFNGDKYYLVEVIAFILKHFKDLLMEEVRQETRSIAAAAQMRVTDFDWVITVPAIWTAKGKQMMRQAAYLAGLCTDAEGITTFTIYGRGNPQPEEENVDHLSLVLEPEAAAIYCQEKLAEGKKASYCTDVTGLPSTSSYLVFDIGGGTVDITAHALDQHGNVEVIELPEGNDWGGTKVNQEFSFLLQDIVGDCAQNQEKDEGFTRFLCSGDKTKRRIILNQIIYNDFEDAKVDFGRKACGTGASQVEDKAVVRLNYEFTSCYNDMDVERVSRLKPGQIAYARKLLAISYTRMESLFKPAVDGIIHVVLPILEKHKGSIKTVYLVGGFGGCKYIYEKLKTEIDAKFHKGTFLLIVPHDYRFAVVEGAVLYRQHPELIQSRKIDATYGIEVCSPFDPNVHKQCYQYYDKEGTALCRNVFSVFVQEGEVVKANEVCQATFLPQDFDQETTNIDIYCTTKSHVQFIKDEDGRANVRRIGSLSLKLPNPEKLRQNQRPFKVLMDFSGPEIQVKAVYDIPSADRIEVSATIDFLSSQTK